MENLLIAILQYLPTSVGIILILLGFFSIIISYILVENKTKNIITKNEAIELMNTKIDSKISQHQCSCTKTDDLIKMFTSMFSTFTDEMKGLRGDIKDLGDKVYDLAKDR